jgi:hypothetical protein
VLAVEGSLVNSTRRSFLSALAALPLLGKMLKPDRRIRVWTRPDGWTIYHNDPNLPGEIVVPVDSRIVRWDGANVTGAWRG